ncbi:MAG: hypothetical protein IJ587_09115 [Synergistaceae bacterium]|nr:hypothetical protein [Synergistaceae bacterium]
MKEVVYSMSTAYYANELTSNLNKLKRISILGYNWDGYGAEPLSAELILHTKNLLRKLHIQPEIFPTADGTIQAEYEKENGDYLELQFTGQGLCEVFRNIAFSEEYFDIPETSEAINSLVGDFYRRSF